MDQRTSESGGAGIGPNRRRTMINAHRIRERFDSRYLTDHQMSRLVALRRRLGRPERPWYSG